jgi:hypothetical protein
MIANEAIILIAKPSLGLYLKGTSLIPSELKRLRQLAMLSATEDLSDPTVALLAKNLASLRRITMTTQNH